VYSTTRPPGSARPVEPTWSDFHSITSPAATTFADAVVIGMSLPFVDEGCCVWHDGWSFLSSRLMFG
jgi:hypothetical protein